MDLPIALCTNSRTCTSHLISHFVSYEKLTPTSIAFVTSISSILFPQSAREALEHPCWKAAMDVDMTTLSDTSTWILFLYLQANLLLVVGGSTP